MRLHEETTFLKTTRSCMRLRRGDDFPENSTELAVSSAELRTRLREETTLKTQHEEGTCKARHEAGTWKNQHEEGTLATLATGMVCSDHFRRSHLLIAAAERETRASTRPLESGDADKGRSHRN